MVRAGRRQDGSLLTRSHITLEIVVSPLTAALA